MLTWNPVKELKVDDYFGKVDLIARGWNPVKELKVPAPVLLPCHELIGVESGEGIERR